MRHYASDERDTGEQNIPDPGTVVAFIVGGEFDSAMGFRARAMAARLCDAYDIQIAYRSRRKIVSMLRLLVFLVRLGPQVIYLFDISYSGLSAGRLYKTISRKKLIIETGDAIVELVRSTGSRGRIGIRLTKLLEETAFHIADRTGGAGSAQKEWLSHQGVEADVIQDGVDTSTWRPEDSTDLRKQYGLDGVMIVGLVGSSI